MNSSKILTSSRKEGWQRRFFNPTIQWMVAARNAPHRVLSVENKSGRFELYAREWVTGFSRRLTNRPGGTLFGSISSDGRFVYFLDDTKGDEHGHFVRIPFSGGRAVDITPSLPKYFSYGVSTNDQGNLLVFTASVTKENRAYLVPFTGQGYPETPRIIYASRNFLSDALLSPDGIYTCIVESGKRPDTNTILLIRNSTGQIMKAIPTVSALGKGDFTALSFSRRSHVQPLLLGITNAKGFYRPVFLNLMAGRVKRVTSKQFRGDIFVLGWFEGEKKMLLCEVRSAQQRLLLYDLRTRTVKRVGPSTGSFDLFFNSAAFLPNKSILLKWKAFGVPPRIIKVMPTSYRKTKNVYAPTPTMRPLRRLKSVWCRSSDGEKVQMWIARPNTRQKPFPMIIDIHGGPHGVASDEFLPEAHAWLDYGFGYCAVNYRGSIGFGKKFERKIYGNPGHWEVEDVVAARNWLVKKGWADPNRVIIFGWSWGGYVTLLALGKYPKLWCGGIAGMPIADWVLQYQDEPAFFKAMDRRLFGGTPKEVPERYKRSSPITYVKDIKAPVLIIHGINDVRCPPRQIIRFERAMRRKEKSIAVQWFSSGHAGEFSNTKLRVSNLAIALKFATRLLKKRSRLS